MAPEPAPAADWPGTRPARPVFDTAAEKPVDLGPFAPRPAATLYVVLDRPHARARVVAQSTGDDYVMLRAFDGAERLVHWQYNEHAPYSDTEKPVEHPRDAYVDGLPLLPMPIDRKDVAGTRTVDGTFALVAEPGNEAWGDCRVHQIRMQAGRSRTQMFVGLSHDMPWGVSFQNGEHARWGGCPDKLYAYVPPRAQHLTVAMRKGAMRITDAGGAELYASAKETKKQIPVSTHETLWTFEPDDGYFEFRAWGFPLILCPTPEAALAIEASVEVMDDGTVVCHKFQRRIAELLPEILTPERVGRAQDLIVPLTTRRDAWLADPLRNIHLTGYSPFLRGIAHALRRQNVDPASRWSGVFEGYTPPEGTAPEDHRWDTFLEVKGVGDYRGKSQSAAEGLAKAATVDDPVNPYFGRKELLFRAAAAGLRDLMILNEAEVWPGATSDPYPSSMSFVMGQKNLPPFALAAPHLPDDVREIWTEGMRRMVDRSFTNTLVSCRNQSAHCLVINEEFAHGMEDPVYIRLSRLYAKRFAAGANLPGWHMEACGPCGSYIGMTHWHFGVYYRQSEDRDFLETIRKSYHYFNHTVAPEPDGRTMLGGFNHHHRVGMGFFQEQWGGARGILDDVLPEVGLWAGPRPSTEEKAKAMEEARTRIDKELDNPKDVFPGSLTDPRFLYYAEPDRTGVWPALEERPYIRNIEDDLVAIRRPGYYMAVYVGKPAAGYYIRGREKLRAPLPGNAESEGGRADTRKVTPLVGGGMTLFWTPAYGTAVMATNWSPLTHHGLVAIKGDNTRWWEDYHATKFEIRPDDGRVGSLTVTGKIEGTSVTYSRRYVLKPHELLVELELTAAADVNLPRLFENVPLVFGKRKTRGVRITVAGERDGRARGKLVEVRDSEGAGIDVSFTDKRDIAVCRNGLVSNYRSYQINRIEVELPTTYRKGERAALTYTLRPVK